MKTLLVANRGEIALRVMKTARAQGYRTVAVHSDADADAPHSRYADEAICIGPPPVAESYLNAERILAAAKQAGASLVHPGYGFLSENAAFAEACGKAGLVFVGPPPKAIAVMGDKAVAKRAMLEAGVPCVPGYQGEDQSDKRLIKEAEQVGFPVMVKAAAGGGGRGMRLVEAPADLAGAIALARSEAASAFGSDELILEKALVRPRHVEVQVFADTQGNAIHLGERDCSVQRRHQKIIEESPCPVMTPELRVAFGKAAVDAARAVGYAGAGTVEFLLAESGDFYFLEMNTRLQVEHPVTECVTGLDLVALQLQVAEGRPLGIRQEEVALKGHAVEVRLYAEDPASGFLPMTGPILAWRPPEGEGVRTDAGIATGGEVSPFYDPMLAKIIAYGASRGEACRKLIQALGQTALFGTHTNRDFLIEALGKPAFMEGRATTAFIAETWPDEQYAPPPLGPAEYALAAVLQCRHRRQQALDQALGIAPELLDWSSAGPLASVVQYDRQLVTVAALAPDHYRVQALDEAVEVQLRSITASSARLTVAGRGTEAQYLCQGADIHLATPTRSWRLTDTAALGAAADEATEGAAAVVAPMHGQLLELLVEEGEAVAPGDKLAILEAMKMQHEITAEAAGTVARLAAAPGAQLAAGDLILEITPTA